MADAQETAQRLAAELEQRGARAVDVQGDLAVDAFDSTNDGQGQRLFGHDAEIQAEYDGDPEWIRNAVAEVQGVQVQRVDDEQYPGGDTRVMADIVLLDGGSGGSNPGGNVDASPDTTPVPPPAEDEQDPHVPPGGTWALEDEAGVRDECEVAHWPVRCWTPPGGVPSVIVLRYIPAPRARGLEWWAGYVLLDPRDDAWSGVPGTSLRTRLEAQQVQWEGHQVPISYQDDDGWVGWSAHDLPVEVAGIPVLSNVPTEVAAMDNHDAGDVTRALSEAALKVRHEVLG